MKAVILAAGKGTRLRPLSNHITKAMMPVANVPIIERLVDQIAAETDIREFVVLANSPEQDVVKYLTRIEKKDMHGKLMQFRFAYQIEQMGMGHALKCVLDTVPIKEPFVLAACDTLYPLGDIGKLVQSFIKSHFDACLALMEMTPEVMTESSTVKINGDLVTKIVEKPSPEDVLSPYASIPLYMIGHEIAGYIKQLEPSQRGELELQDAFRMWISDGGRFGYKIVSGKDTITTIADLVALNKKYAGSIAMDGEAEWDSALVVEPVLAGEKTEVGTGSVIGPNAVIGGGTRIGAECRIKDAVVFAKSRIPDGYVVENGCWHGDRFFPA